MRVRFGSIRRRARGCDIKIARMSLGRRIELARRIREIGRRVEFLEAGDDVRDKLEAAVLQGEIDRAYLEWGLEGDRGARDRRGGGDAGVR